MSSFVTSDSARLKRQNRFSSEVSRSSFLSLDLESKSVSYTCSCSDHLPYHLRLLPSSSSAECTPVYWEANCVRDRVQFPCCVDSCIPSSGADPVCAVFLCPANGTAAKGGNFDVCMDVDARSCTQEWGWKG